MDVNDYLSALESEATRLIKLAKENALAVQNEMLLTFPDFNRPHFDDIPDGCINILNNDILLQNLCLQNNAITSYIEDCIEYIDGVRVEQKKFFDDVVSDLKKFSNEKTDFLYRTKEIVDCLTSDLDYIISFSESDLYVGVNNLFCNGEVGVVNDMVLGKDIPLYDLRPFEWSRNVILAKGTVYEKLKVFEKETHTSNCISNENAKDICTKINSAMQVILEQFMDKVLCAVEGISDAISVESGILTEQAIRITGIYSSGFYEKRIGIKFPPLRIGTQKINKSLGVFYGGIVDVSCFEDFCMVWKLNYPTEKDSPVNLISLRDVAMKECNKILKNLRLRLEDEVFTQIANAVNIFSSSFLHVEELIVYELESNKKKITNRLRGYDELIARLEVINSRVYMASKYVIDLQKDIDLKFNK